MMFVTEKCNRLDLLFDGDIFLSSLKSLCAGSSGGSISAV